MAEDPRHAEAAAMIETHTEVEIAEHFGVSRTTVRRWIHPEERERARQTSLKWKKENPEKTKAYDKAYQVGGAHCIKCGEPMGRGIYHRGVCHRCVKKQEDARMELIRSAVTKMAKALKLKPKDVAREIAELYGVGPPIYAKPAGSRSTPEIRLRAIELWLDGLPKTEVARIVGFSDSAVHQWIKNSGVQREP